MILTLEDASPVHQVKDVRVEKGFRIVLVNCGANMPPEKSSERPYDWTVWGSDVTCPGCKP